MEEAVAICKPGVAYRELGNRIEEVVKPMGYSIVRRYTGHGIHNLVSSCGKDRSTNADCVSFSSTVSLISFITVDRRCQGRWKRGKCSQ
jgi:hypothetical protein